jgi:hypothetical protein
LSAKSDPTTNSDGKESQQRKTSLLKSETSRRPKLRGASQKKKGAQPENPANSKTAKPTRNFPTITLEDALKIPQAIRQKNSGHPLDTNLVAQAYGLARGNTRFFYVTTASRDNGLTTGTRDTQKISLTEFGRSLLYATSQEDERRLKIEAFFNVPKFKQIYDYYNGCNLPEHQYLANALENEFGILPSHHAEFTEVFTANCKYLGIENGLGNALPASHENGDTKSLDMRALGKPKGDFEYVIFVIMPFSEKGKQERPKGFFDEVLKSLITPAANRAGFAVETARREDSDIIHHTIINELLNADLVIADLTDHNPNVLFELGIRLAMEKPVVLIKSKDTGAIFDVDNLLRVYPYDQNLWNTTVQADVQALAERITGTWDNRENVVGYIRILTTGPKRA